jgi:hypothetical protein
MGSLYVNYAFNITMANKTKELAPCRTYFKLDNSPDLNARSFASFFPCFLGSSRRFLDLLNLKQ